MEVTILGTQTRRSDNCRQHDVSVGGMALTITETEVGIHISRKGKDGIMAGNTWVHHSWDAPKAMTDEEEACTRRASEAFRSGECQKEENSR